MRNVDVQVSFTTDTPLTGGSPKILINEPGKYELSLYNMGGEVDKVLINGGEVYIGHRQWFTNWKIIVKDLETNDTFIEQYNAKNEVVFIKMDAYALGDTIAWIPYVEEFRKKHQCKVICSTFHNDLFINSYPDIMFVKPNTKIDNIYAQYYIGAQPEMNYKYAPSIPINTPLQKIATDILGLPYEEIKPRISYSPILSDSIEGKYVCISEFASSEDKMWGGIGGWQQIVNYLNKEGYDVVVISKEKTYLYGVIDKSGDIPLSDRINDLLQCEFFIGVSSGLSWLAWALDKRVIMISDGTPHYHEFQCDRVGANKNGNINYNIPISSSVDDVINTIKVS